MDASDFKRGWARKALDAAIAREKAREASEWERENAPHVSRTWNAILAKGKTVVAVGDTFQMRVTRIRSVRGVLQGRATNGTWTTLPLGVLFRVTP